MTSEKLRTEILPLLNNCSDEDIDELDDEVAMISHKKEHIGGARRRKDEISLEDVKIQFADDKKGNKTTGTRIDVKAGVGK